jgi:hypothetical protein
MTFIEWLRERRIQEMTSDQMYKLANSEAANIIGSSSPVDPDNGRSASYQQNMATSDVLGIILALRRKGYVIRKRLLP